MHIQTQTLGQNTHTQTHTHAHTETPAPKEEVGTDFLPEWRQELCNRLITAMRGTDGGMLWDVRREMWTGPALFIASPPEGLAEVLQGYWAAVAGCLLAVCWQAG